jgi:hypothetical protein
MPFSFTNAYRSEQWLDFCSYQFLIRYRTILILYYDDSVTVFDCLLRILEEMAVVVFAEQRGEDVLKKLLQVW